MRRTLMATLFLFLLPTARADQENVQVLIGMTDLELQRTMNMVRGSLGVHCDYCHVVDDKNGWDFPSDTKETKRVARQMMVMTAKLNREQFAGRADVSCNTCHQGAIHTPVLVSMPQTPPPFPTPLPAPVTLPSLDEIVKHYTTAVGDATRLQSARAMRGTRTSSDGKLAPIEIQEANGKVHVQIEGPNGKVEQGYDTTNGWSRDAKGNVSPFRSNEVENFRQLTEAFAPLVPSAIPTNATVTGKEKVGDHDTYVVSARLDQKMSVRLNFDTKTGLLVRRTLIKTTPIGPVPQQTDFDDYRDVSGTKFPFLVRVSLVDPWTGSTRRYTDVKLGATVDDAIFKTPK